MDLILSSTPSFSIKTADRADARFYLAKLVSALYGSRCAGIWLSFKWREMDTEENIRKYLVPVVSAINDWLGLPVHINIIDRNFGAKDYPLPIPTWLRDKVKTYRHGNTRYGPVWEDIWVDAQLATIGALAKVIAAEKLDIREVQFGESTIHLPNQNLRGQYQGNFIRLHTRAAQVLAASGTKVGASINWFGGLEKVSKLALAMPPEVRLANPDAAPGMFELIKGRYRPAEANYASRDKVHSLQVYEAMALQVPADMARFSPHIESRDMRSFDYFESLMCLHHRLGARRVWIRSVFSSKHEKGMGVDQFAGVLIPQIDRFLKVIKDSPAPPAPEPEPPEPDPDPPAPGVDPEEVKQLIRVMGASLDQVQASLDNAKKILEEIGEDLTKA